MDTEVKTNPPEFHYVDCKYSNYWKHKKYCLCLYNNKIIYNENMVNKVVIHLHACIQPAQFQ